jgi:hypothetical protein
MDPSRRQIAHGVIGLVVALAIIFAVHKLIVPIDVLTEGSLRKVFISMELIAFVVLVIGYVVREVYYWGRILESDFDSESGGKGDRRLVVRDAVVVIGVVFGGSAAVLVAVIGILDWLRLN